MSSLTTYLQETKNGPLYIPTWCFIIITIRLQEIYFPLHFLKQILQSSHRNLAYPNTHSQLRSYYNVVQIIKNYTILLKI